MRKIIIEWDENRPLDRVKGEGRRANAALVEYFNMGAGRSLRKLMDLFLERTLNDNLAPPTTRIWTLNSWSMENAWDERVKRAEEIQRKEDARILRDERLARQREWQARAEETREADYQIAQRLRDTANHVLDQAPNFLKTKRRFVPGTNGEPDKEIITVALDAQTAIKAAETASRLARLASANNLITSRSHSERSPAWLSYSAARSAFSPVRSGLTTAISSSGAASTCRIFKPRASACSNTPLPALIIPSPSTRIDRPAPTSSNDCRINSLFLAGCRRAFCGSGFNSAINTSNLSSVINAQHPSPYRSVVHQEYR